MIDVAERNIRTLQAKLATPVQDLFSLLGVTV